jgi:hypothetical protein
MESAGRQIAGDQGEVEHPGGEQKIDDGKNHDFFRLSGVIP